MYSIACASVVAKVVRDRMMDRLAVRYPEYGWERNAGYATREHRDAIRAHGLTPHHRRSFQALHVLLAGDQLALFDATMAVGVPVEGAPDVDGADGGSLDDLTPDAVDVLALEEHRAAISAG